MGQRCVYEYVTSSVRDWFVGKGYLAIWLLRCRETFGQTQGVNCFVMYRDQRVCMHY